MTLHLFQGYGIELEYMIVDRETLSVKPICDQILQKLAGTIVSEFEIEGVGISNELALHVLELKTAEPVPAIGQAVPALHRVVAMLNSELAAFGARLLPGGMHPWMDPAREMVLWPHEYHEIYQTYHRIFDCAKHGWINLQSIHLNLPFAGDDEFGRLHAAVRYLLPLMPALAASSPIVAGAPADNRDSRLIAYQENQRLVPSIAGQIVPEPVYTAAAYQEQVLTPMYLDLKHYDPAGTLCFEWLNSRGAIARFDRNAIEIRVLDMQECPNADGAMTATVAAILRALVEERWAPLDAIQDFPQTRLRQVFQGCVSAAETATIDDGDYLRGLGITASRTTARDVWLQLMQRVQVEPVFASWWDVYRRHGSLATRILSGVGATVSPERLQAIYRRLADCLLENNFFEP